MNCHHHDFVGLPSHHSTRSNNQAMHEIAIHHDVNHPLTTAYAVHTQETAEQRDKRSREVAMAKAAAVTRLYGGTTPNLPVAQPVQQPPTAVVTSVAPRRGTAMSEPGFLAVNGSFRKSSSSLMSNGDLSGGSNHSLPNNSNHNEEEAASPPPPLQTEATDFLLTPPKLKAETVTTNLPTLQKMPAPRHHLQAPRRVSDSLTTISTTRQQYKERPSFQANDSITSSSGTPILPRKPPPPLYPSVVAQGNPAAYRNSTMTNSNTSDGGLLRGLAIEEQAHMLQRCQQQQQAGRGAGAMSTSTSDTRTLAVQEQEKLWQQLSNSHNSIGAVAVASSLSPTTSASKLSPQEEQAKLWNQITSSARNTSSSNTTSRQYPTRDPLEEQAQLLEAFQQKRTPRLLSAVEEQERMLRSFQAKSNPIEEQAKRLREIQDAKEKKILEMACQMSTRLPPDQCREDEEDMQMIMELSRREAEEHTRAQQDLEQRGLQQALQRSQQDLDVVDLVRQQEQSVDLELRRSIAELALQSSEHTLESLRSRRRSSRPMGVANR